MALHQNWSIFSIIAIYPFLILVATIWKVSLYSTPADKGFGLVSILAGVEKASLEVLKGASLSGKLERPVRLRIGIAEDVRNLDGGGKGEARLLYEVDSKAQHGKVKRRKIYH